MAVIRRSRGRKTTEAQESPKATEPLQSIAYKAELAAEEPRAKTTGRTDPDTLILKYKEKIVNRKTAIRSHCVECMGGSPGEVARCTSDDCSLWAYRMGESPNDRRTIAAKLKRGEV